MRRMTKLVKAREQQRADAVQQLNTQRERLELARRAGQEREEAAQAALQQSLGRATLSAGQLESMDAVRAHDRQATQRAVASVMQAKGVVLDTHRKLRQLEILREHSRELQRREEARREQRSLDGLVRPRGGTLLAIVVLGGALAPLAACGQVRRLVGNDAPAGPEQASSATITRGAQPSTVDRSLPHHVDAGPTDAGPYANAFGVAEAGVYTSAAPSEPKHDGPSTGSVPLGSDVVRVLTRMSTRAAAAVLSAVNPAQVAALLARMPAADATRLLAQIDAEHAARVVELLQVQDRPTATEASRAQITGDAIPTATPTDAATSSPARGEQASRPTPAPPGWPRVEAGAGDATPRDRELRQEHRSPSEADVAEIGNPR
jgi:hypothetical protein